MKQAYPPAGIAQPWTDEMADGRNTTKRNGRSGGHDFPTNATNEPAGFVFLLTADKDEGAGQKYDSQRPTGHPGVDRYVDSASS